MQKTNLPRALMGPLHAFFGFLTGGMPVSKEPGKAKRPYERAKEITQKACAKAAAVSGGLALPVGPLGMLTVLPDLIIVWRIQAQMVVSQNKLDRRYSSGWPSALHRELFRWRVPRWCRLTPPWTRKKLRALRSSCSLGRNCPHANPKKAIQDPKKCSTSTT
jgi:hypothetical protein